MAETKVKETATYTQTNTSSIVATKVAAKQIAYDTATGEIVMQGKEAPSASGATSTTKVNSTVKDINTVQKPATMDASGSGSGGGGGGGDSDSGGSNGSGLAEHTYDWSTFTGYDSGLFPIDPQIFWVYDSNSTVSDYIYEFDGVIKIEHSRTMKVEEEPDEEHASEYVNNAKNEPDQVTVDVMMSNVYTTRNGLTAWGDDRIISAFEVVDWMKRERKKFDVITSLYTYKDMLLVGVSTIQDETCPYGWYGQLVFQEAYGASGGGGGGGDSGGASASTSSGTTSGSGVTSSLLYQGFGKIV